MLESIEAFKPGRHRASNGKVYTFTAEDVAQIAASYDPAVQAAPIVLGHPKSDDPAWGWAESLSVNDEGVLCVAPEKIDPAFAEGVDAGRYRYVSAALYSPEDDRNPKPGAWYLRHLGFLGAQPPAVKGLSPAFSDEPGDLVEFSTADGYWVRDIFRSMRDFFIEKFGLDVADKVIPSWSVDNVEVTPPPAPVANSADGVDYMPSFSEADIARQAELTARENALAAREAAITAKEVEFSEAGRTEARAADTTFVDSLVAAGKLPPAQRDRTVALFARLGGDDTVSFAEADADPRAELRDLLGGLGVSITFAEVAAPNGFDGVVKTADLAHRAGELVNAATARGETLSYAEAVARAQVG